jgi:hypothetical protein
MSPHNRREFLKRAAATAGVATTFAIAGTKASGRVLGANDRVRIAVAGIGRMLTYDAQAEKFVEAPDANQLLTLSYRGPFVVPERV